MPVVSRDGSVVSLSRKQSDQSFSSAPGVSSIDARSQSDVFATQKMPSLRQPILADKLLKEHRGHTNHEDFDITLNPNYRGPLETVHDKEKGWHEGWHLGHGCLDECITLGIMVVALVGAVLYHKVWWWFRKFAFEHDFELITVLKFANDVTQVTMYLLLFVMWVTLVYRWPAIHEKVWKWKSWFLPNMMSGGFAPRPTALSLGILMFATSTLFDIDVVSGNDLLDANQWADNKWEQCRATDLEVADRKKIWFSRFYRHAPAQRGFTCYGVDEYDLLGYVFTSHRFTHADIQNSENNGTAPPGLLHPFHNESRILLGGSLPQELLGWIDNQFTTPNITTKDCMYQCVKWRQVSFLKFLKNIGIIASGCGIIVKGTEFFTQIVGEKMGGGLVTPDTSAKEFERLVKMKYIDGIQSRLSRFCCLPCVRSKFFCALLLAALILGPLCIAPRIDIDGYYTEDFYVTSVFLASVLISLLVRMWSPYVGDPILYTTKMWTEGADSFVRISQYDDVPIEKQSIDLYQWVHLTYRQRANHLLMYARGVSMKQVDKAIQDHKEARNELRVYVISANSQHEQGQILLEQTGCKSCRISYTDLPAEARSLKVGDVDIPLKGNAAKVVIDNGSLMLHGASSLIDRHLTIVGADGKEISSGKIKLLSHWLKVSALDDFEHTQWRRRRDNRVTTRFTVTVSRGAEGIVVNKTESGHAIVLWFKEPDVQGGVLVQAMTDKDCALDQLLTNEEMAWDFIQAEVSLDKLIEVSKDWSAARDKFHLRHCRIDSGHNQIDIEAHKGCCTCFEAVYETSSEPSAPKKSARVVG